MRSYINKYNEAKEVNVKIKVESNNNDKNAHDLGM